MVSSAYIVNSSSSFTFPLGLLLLFFSFPQLLFTPPPFPSPSLPLLPFTFPFLHIFFVLRPLHPLVPLSQIFLWCSSPSMFSITQDEVLSVSPLEIYVEIYIPFFHISIYIYIFFFLFDLSFIFLPLPFSMHRCGQYMLLS